MVKKFLFAGLLSLHCWLGAGIALEKYDLHELRELWIDDDYINQLTCEQCNKLYSDSTGESIFQEIKTWIKKHQYFIVGTGIVAIGLVVCLCLSESSIVPQNEQSEDEGQSLEQQHQGCTPPSQPNLPTADEIIEMRRNHESAYQRHRASQGLTTFDVDQRLNYSI